MTRPVAILIAALGGEGGGVLTDWLVEAATAEGLPVQKTSIPGVAQRTGATTYYVEIYPDRDAPLDDGAPVLGLYPSPGGIDLMVASELVEAGRAMEMGFVTPDRTTLVASSHRIYAIGEKTALGDGLIDHSRIVRAAGTLAKRPILSDFAALAREQGTVINAVILGAIAEADILPVGAERLEAAIRAGGVAVEASLRGFNAGRASVRGEGPKATAAPARPRALSASGLEAQLQAEFPAACHAILGEGLRRVIDFQDPAYGALYLDRMQRILALEQTLGTAGGEFPLTRETGRYLALWMAYQDVIRVADQKSRPDRLTAVRAEVGAKADEPVRISEFLKPGIEEIVSVLPAGLGRTVRRWAARSERARQLHFTMRLRTDSISGYLRLRLLAGLRGWRRRSLRFEEEQAGIGRWLELIERAGRIGPDFAMQVAELARLIKGYGDTHERGRTNFELLIGGIVEPALTGQGPTDPARALADGIAAALADDKGTALHQALETTGEASGDGSRRNVA